MKNLKKVLAMVLAFACTFSMFAGAKVFEDVPAGSDYSEAITMLSDLGVIQGKDDGKYHPEDTITRAEACAMIARLMTGDPNVSQYVGAQSFTDVAKGSWKDSAIGYCYINGIVIGVGNNKFEPDRAITDAEFVTMVVRAMGYETADMKQNYPFSYMSNAQAIGLLDGTNMVASTDALRGEDAQVIYNALFADYARGAKLVNTTHGTSVETYPTLAESVWGLERAAVGTWTKDSSDDENVTLTNCKAHTWVVIGADPDEDGHILAYPIDDDTTDMYNSKESHAYTAYSFKYAGDANAIKGYQVELWGEGSHGEPTWEKGDDKFVYSEDWEIKAIKTVKGQTAYDYNASMADSKSDNGTIELEDASLDLESVADNAAVISNEGTYSDLTTYLSKDEYNGVKTTSDKNVEKALNVRDGAQYKLMDWDSDGDVDWVVVDEANYYKVESVTSKRLTVSSMLNEGNEDTQISSKNVTWKLDDLNDATDYKVNYVVPEDLEEGDIIEVTYTNAYDKGEKKEVVTATVTKVESETAELDKVSTKDDLELTFGDDVLKIAENTVLGDVVVPANPAKYEDFDDEELGTEFALWQNRNGFIVYSDYANETSNYMMILDTKDGSDKTGDRSLAVADILLADNSVKKDVEFASDLKIDGESNGNGYDKDEDRSWDENKVVGNVYKFWQNEDGVITKMESVFNTKNVTKNAQDSDYSYAKKADRLSNEGNKSGTVAALENADVLFAVTTNYIHKDGNSDANLKVDAEDVLAVEQSDIPEIVASDTVNTNDTKAAQMTANKDNWLTASKGTANTAAYIANVDASGDATAAILGVENFNQFDAASTKVGLVTSVSYDKNDVVEVEVAYNGEVTTVKSAEDVDFEDVVEQYNGSSDDDLTTKEAAALLKNNAAYAEITTNADGVLTNVTFMDVNGNTAKGHYYEVNRDVIKAVKSGYITVGTDTYTFADDENLYSVGYLNTKSKDLADDVLYYSIDGTPTIYDTKSADYTDKVLAIANGFDGNPDITAETASNLGNGSDVDDEFNDADTYVIADVASKIGGDVVAVYTFDDTLGEVDAEANAKAIPSVTKLTFATPDADDQKFTWTEIGGADVDKVVSSDTTIATVSYTSGNEATVTPKKAGKVVVELFDGDTKVGQVEVEVQNIALPDYTLGEATQGKSEVTAVANAKVEITVGGTVVGTSNKACRLVIGTDSVAFDSVVSNAANTATAIADAVNGDDAMARKYRAEANSDKVTITAVTSDVKEFTATVSKPTAETGTFNAVATPVTEASAQQKGVATLTITSSAKTNATLQLVVDGNKFTGTASIKEGDSAETIANKIATACSSSIGYDVSAKGNVITVAQKDSFIKNQDMVLSIVEA
ncbi:hypothetical protein B5F17_05330 [Butyricicoccus pullicaecorum]|uniref:SLH domain-containing protein n=1 Tax=Butyricicoccus pullicaecorum TaxID=501571 RepID=A0A1Y4LC49_9FIRM|nr:S-layer homology domain-containing protein [Butyricicoccus pullicaecorum]OUP53430.1 hypothetical protein B5F17_05330 [Butyricicoccus pullicaecorum]